jgi:hypothetical protein
MSSIVTAAVAALLITHVAAQGWSYLGGGTTSAYAGTASYPSSRIASSIWLVEGQGAYDGIYMWSGTTAAGGGKLFQYVCIT